MKSRSDKAADAVFWPLMKVLDWKSGNIYLRAGIAAIWMIILTGLLMGLVLGATIAFKILGDFIFVNLRINPEALTLVVAVIIISAFIYFLMLGMVKDVTKEESNDA